MFRQSTERPCASLLRVKVKGDSRDGPSRRLTIADPLSMLGATRRFAGLGGDDGDDCDYGTRYRGLYKR